LIGKMVCGTVNGMNFQIRPFSADDAAWLVSVHETHYREGEGFDDTFAPLVADIIAEFLAQDDQIAQAGWVARDDTHRLGSIFCVRNDAATAKLRLFFVVEQARGRGVAQALLDQCLGFSKDQGYAGLTLWTHESHRAAGAIYARNGLQRVTAKPVHSFGVDLIEETWEITF
jgi:GNAT superfamily N-acetyltransferase